MDSTELLLKVPRSRKANFITEESSDPSHLPGLCVSKATAETSELKRSGRKFNPGSKYHSLLPFSEKRGVRALYFEHVFSWKSTFSVWTINAHTDLCNCALVIYCSRILANSSHTAKTEFLFLLSAYHETSNTSSAPGTVYSWGYRWNKQAGYVPGLFSA